MKRERPNLEEYFLLPNPGLRAYFARVKHGNTADYRPPFWQGLSRSQVLGMWQKELDKLDLRTKYSGLYDFEMEMKSKVGPMSIQLPLSERIDTIESYYEILPSEPIDERAIAACIAEFRPLAGVRLRSPEQTKQNMRLSTNSGTPYFRKRRLVQNLSDKGFKRAAVLGWRGQEGGPEPDDVKQRVVFMFPFQLNVEELQFYQPAIEVIQKHKLIPAYVNMDWVDKEVTALFDSKPRSDVVICTDFRRFDQHFNEHMQHAAKSVLQTLCPHLVEWLELVFPQKYSIPLICDEELMYRGPHGMGSGSGGTNFDECLSHRSLQYEAAITDGQKLNPHSMAYGDDGILTYPGITLDHIIDTYTKHGQEMNPAKQMVSKTEAVVLRRWHSMEYRENGIMVGVYATFRALGRLLAQERFYDPEKWGPKAVTLRAWSIIENCNHHPFFEQFVEFVKQGDKFKLGLLIPGFMDNIEQEVAQAIEELPDFMGYTKTLQEKVGIKEWRIYKYLKGQM